MIVSCNLARASLFRLKYPANLAGVPDALIFFCLLFFHQGKALCRGQGSLPGTFFGRMIVSRNLARASLFRLKYPDNLPGLHLSPLRYLANWAGIPDALIFFCLLFFHQGKKRRKKSYHFSHQEKAPNREPSSLPGAFFECMIVSCNLTEVSSFSHKESLLFFS